MLIVTLCNGEEFPHSVPPAQSLVGETSSDSLAGEQGRPTAAGQGVTQVCIRHPLCSLGALRGQGLSRPFCSQRTCCTVITSPLTPRFVDMTVDFLKKTYASIHRF